MTIGILGGGQLGYMLALAGYPLGLHFRFLDPSPEAPVGRIAQRVTAEYTDHAALEKFSSGLELVTYEFENVPVEAAKFLAQRVPVYPPPAALEAAQDRLNEKTLFQKLGISTTEFLPISKPAEFEGAVQQLGLPAVLKTSRMGYDGKGQWILRTSEDVSKAQSELPKVPLIVERFVPFTRELSVLAIRARTGETAFYPLVENHHRGGILRLSLAPAPALDQRLQRAAEDIARRVLEALQYVGVLAIEFFEHEGRLLANEMAPRVHNSGHWTIEGAITSQFENHLRAVLGLPLGSTGAAGHCAMVNLIGDLPESAEVLAVPDAHLHLYGKVPRPGRKLGHITLRAASPERLALRLSELPAFFHRPDFFLDSVLAQSPSAHR
ncbi:MAG TPA: 5-(carboxyamino)imidazole ribonucleotide synthase [Methylomirabilota bacterium]|nr:5-(carboxyamino)imidazole ribonucleotide synthase [Methylomirabilota bacterium]